MNSRLVFLLFLCACQSHADEEEKPTSQSLWFRQINRWTVTITTQTLAMGRKIDLLETEIAVFKSESLAREEALKTWLKETLSVQIRSLIEEGFKAVCLTITMFTISYKLTYYISVL